MLVSGLFESPSVTFCHDVFGYGFFMYTYFTNDRDFCSSGVLFYR
jgi:hypothetical protein